MDDVDATGECDIPDSLPPAFHYREHMKLHTPAKTYGKRSRRREEEAGKLYVDSPKKEEGGGSGKRKRGQQSRSTTTPESAVKKRRGVKTLGMFSDARGGAGDKGKQEGSGSERRLRSGKKRA